MNKLIFKWLYVEPRADREGLELILLHALSQLIVRFIFFYSSPVRGTDMANVSNKEKVAREIVSFVNGLP